MGLALTIARRSLLGRPARTLFSILGVALGIAVVVAVFTVDHVSVLSRTQKLEPGFGADLEVRPSGSLADPREELLKLEGVAGVAAFFQNDVRMRRLEPVSGADEKLSVQLVALEAGSGRTLGVYHVDQGADLAPRGDATGPPEILLGERLAEELGLAVGERVLLAPNARAAKPACVDGVLQRPPSSPGEPIEQVFRVAGTLAYEGIGRRASGRVVVIEYESGRELFQDVFVESQFWLRRAADVDPERLEAGLSKAFSFVRNEQEAVGQMADERAFRNGVRMAGLFALLLGLYVIFHTLSMSLSERVREVGVLHALGTSSAQVARVFFGEALFIATVAGALGFGLGLALAALLLRRGITTLGVVGHPVGPFEVPWRTTVSLASIGVVIALVGSVWPILRARGTDVVQALRGTDLARTRATVRGFQVFAAVLLTAVVPAFFFFVAPVIGAADAALVETVLVGLAVLALFVALPLVLPSAIGGASALVTRPFERLAPLAGKLAARNLRHSPTRVGASVSAIALVAAAFVALRGMTASLVGEVGQWGQRAVRDKVWFENLPDAPTEELYAALHELPEVLGVENGDARVYVNFLLLGVRPAELARSGPVEDARLLARLEAEQGVIVSKRMAQARNLRAGDAVAVNTSGHGVQSFRVLAVSDEYGYFVHPDERVYGVTSERWLRKYFCVDTERTSMVAVRLEKGADTLDVEELMRDRFPDPAGMHVQTGRTVMGLHYRDLVKDFVLFDIILFLTAVLAGLGVLNGQLLAALERRTELGVLRALGTTGAQLFSAVSLESTVVGALGGILGVAVGTALVPVVVSSLRVLSGLDLPVVWYGRWIPLALAGALLVAWLAGIYPVWRMSRTSAVEAVRTGSGA
jgi:putative ABC transport system permease protein